MQLHTEQNDFYRLSDGRMVMTEAAHLRRGYCCGNGCLHCPYQYVNVVEPKRSILLAQKNESCEKGSK
ncbi:MAG: hypothetical protein JSS64_05120 [Bacteroidetes bacterium]|nr:hypothetical protein [Bacteroidota bacterium]